MSPQEKTKEKISKLKPKVSISQFTSSPFVNVELNNPQDAIKNLIEEDDITEEQGYNQALMTYLYMQAEMSLTIFNAIVDLHLSVVGLLNKILDSEKRTQKILIKNSLQKR